MKNNLITRRLPALLLSLLMAVLLFLLPACGSTAPSLTEKNDPATQEGTALPAEDGVYSTPKEVAEYLHIYGQLPQNYLTKQQAKALGWSASEGNLWEVAEDMSIGGDRFGNREGCLPEVEGRVWYECDVNYAGGFRGAERLLYSNDGLIYYTNNHYESFTPIYGEEETP